jgi:RimJ/RimL family protein N-acetyltransferase
MVVAPGLRVTTLTDPAAFAERVDPVVRRDPVACSVLATNLRAALQGSTLPNSRWILVETDYPAGTNAAGGGPGHADGRVADPSDTRPAGGDVVLAGMIAPPHPLWLTPVRGAPAEQATGLLARALATAPDGPGPVLPGVRGVIGSARPFARAWQRLTGYPHEVRMAQRMFELTDLTEPGGVPGRGRPADLTDRDLCIDWMHAFHAEALPRETAGDVVRIVERRITQGGLSLWEDGARPVSLAGTSVVVAGVARIGPVYTPPHLRGHGYGAAATATASRAGFAAGAARCMLFTDLANPTSNALYPRLGYHPVGDAVHYVFLH